nr:hypothetical protein [Tanacetum cinerariifolium]
MPLLKKFALLIKSWYNYGKKRGTPCTIKGVLSFSHDTVCAYIASQSNDSHVKYEDINQIDKDDIEEINIKWNMALLSLSQVEARLVEFKNQEIKFCEKIRGLKFKVKSKDNRIKRLTKELEELKKENEGLDSKLIVYSPSKKDMSWTGLPEFADDTITDYSRPSPSIESNSSDLQNSGSSIFEKGDSSESIMLNP